MNRYPNIFVSAIILLVLHVENVSAQRIHGYIATLYSKQRHHSEVANVFVSENDFQGAIKYLYQNHSIYLALLRRDIGSVNTMYCCKTHRTIPVADEQLKTNGAEQAYYSKMVERNCDSLFFCLHGAGKFPNEQSIRLGGTRLLVSMFEIETTLCDCLEPIGNAFKAGDFKNKSSVDERYILVKEVYKYKNINNFMCNSMRPKLILQLFYDDLLLASRKKVEKQ